jgi:hypothetical protein
VAGAPGLGDGALDDKKKLINDWVDDFVNSQPADEQVGLVWTRVVSCSNAFCAWQG